MTFFEFSIGDDDIDRRLDRVIRKFLKSTPLSLVYKNIRSGFIRINNAKVKSEYRIQKGDTLFVEKNFFSKNEFDILDALTTTSKTIDIDFDTIFENEHIKIINKPYGINVQSSTKDDVSIDTIIKDLYIQNGLHKTSLSFIPGPLHRIDKNTTGALAFSQSLKGARYFSDAMRMHCIKKEYLCVLSGEVKSDCTWEHAIEKNSMHGSGEFVRVNVLEISECSDKTKYAKTHVHPLGFGLYEGESITFALIRIETGKTHQIRSQASFCKHPLLGDTAYGYVGSSKQFYLHAHVLEFQKDNPIGLPEKVIADLPISFKKFIKHHLPNVVIPSYNSSNESIN